MNKGSDVFVSDIVTDGREHGPSLGLWSSLGDLCRWALANLNRGELDGQRILHAASYDVLWKPEVRTGYPAPWDHVGLGWWASTGSVEHPVVFYDGWDVGFASSIRLAPKDNIGVVVAGNLWTSEAENMGEASPGYAGMLAGGLLGLMMGA
jgi:CubicO group peptidase (beta-lactamase class C family)